MNINYTIAHKLSVGPENNYQYQPFTVCFTGSEFSAGSGIIKFDYSEELLSNLKKQFSIYYKITYDTWNTPLLSNKQFIKITNTPSSIFFKYDPDSGELINNTINVDLYDVWQCYVQLFAKTTCNVNSSNIQFGHLSINNTMEMDTYLYGNLISLINKVEYEKDLDAEFNEALANISIDGLFASNNDINFIGRIRFNKKF